MKKYKYKNLSAIPYELKFPITAKPSVLLQILVDNLNLYDSGWEAGDCIEAPEKVFAINHEYCWDVLQRMAQEFNTEWEIVGKTVHLRKAEYCKDAPLALSYGKGNGFKPGVGRRNKGDKWPVTILYVQGGDRNIDFAGYGSKTLLLPLSATLEYEGRRYKTDAHGMMITRDDRHLAVCNEDSYDASDIYPQRVGEASEVTVVDAEGNLYDFADASIPEDLNFEECLIPNEPMTVIFQTGALAGREFEVKYTHAERRFEIMPAKLDGFDMPNETFKPSVGDKYAVFHIMLPGGYICNDATQSGASWDMFRQAVRYMYDNEEEQFTFSGELDGIWASRNWLEIGGKIRPGGYVSFTDAQFQQEPVLIRITGVTDYLNSPHSPQIDLSNAPVGGFLGSELGKLEAGEVITKELHNEAVRFTQRRYRDAIELGAALERMFTNFAAGISPAFVRTMQLLVGDERLQLRFVDSKTSPQEVDHAFACNDTTKVFSTPAGIIQHMTLGVNALAPSHAVNEYRFWDMAAYTSPPLEGEGALWLYARCGKTNANGTFLLSAPEIQDTASDYYFPIGYLNSEYEGTRSFVPLYGFTEITPGQMRVNKVISSDGTQYFDMLARRFRIGDADSFLSWNVDRANGLVLKGTIVQSPSGDTDYLGVDRGNYVAGTTYYPGDTVKYSDGNIYKCVQQTTDLPTNATYWKLMATKGDPGEPGAPGTPGEPGEPGVEGQGYKYAYYPSDSLAPPEPPPTPGMIPLTWTSSPAFGDKRYIYVSQCIKTEGNWGVWSTPSLYAMKPEKGDPGPAAVFRGEFEPGGIYCNNAARRDVVKYGDIYYIYKGADGASNGSWSSGNWEIFGAQFSSIATDLLLAPNANVGGWIFKNGRLESQSGGMYLDGRTGSVSIGEEGENRIEIDYASRSIVFRDSYGDVVASLDFADTNEYAQVSPKLTLMASDGSPFMGKTVVDNDGITIHGSRSGSPVAKFTTEGIFVLNLPVSPDNLPYGSFYNDGGTVKIKT